MFRCYRWPLLIYDMWMWTKTKLRRVSGVHKYFTEKRKSYYEEYQVGNL